MRLVHKVMLSIWFTIPLIDLLIPTHSIYKGIFKVQAYLILSVYLILFILSWLIASNLILKKAILKKKNHIFNIEFSLIRFCTYICLVGLILLAIDKVYIQGIDYTNGIALAKYQLIENAEDRNSPSSVFSILGYLFLGLCYWNVAFLVISTIVNKPNNKTYLFLSINTFIVFATSFLTGGRTSIIILVAFFVSSLMIRNIYGANHSFFTKRVKLLTQIFGLTTFFFLVYVFGSRAASNNIEPKEYAEIAIVFLEGVPNSLFYSIDNLPLPVSNFIYLFLILIVYYVHSVWVLEGTISINSYYGDASFIGLKNVFHKIGLSEEPIPWEYSGKFISFPGAIFHDFHIKGLILIALLHGLILGITSTVIYCRKAKIIHILIFILFYSIILTAPFIVFIDLLMLPSVLVGGLIFIILHKLNKIRFDVN